MKKQKVSLGKRVAALYDDPTRKMTFRAIANIYHRAESTIREAYYREKKKQEKGELA